MEQIKGAVVGVSAATHVDKSVMIMLLSGSCAGVTQRVAQVVSLTDSDRLQKLPKKSFPPLLKQCLHDIVTLICVNSSLNYPILSYPCKTDRLIDMTLLRTALPAPAVVRDAPHYRAHSACHLHNSCCFITSLLHTDRLLNSSRGCLIDGKPPKGCRRSKTKVAKRLKVADSV